MLCCGTYISNMCCLRLNIIGNTFLAITEEKKNKNDRRRNNNGKLLHIFPPSVLIIEHFPKVFFSITNCLINIKQNV